MQKGKTAIVTGSTSGIGHGIAAALAAEGCDVMLNGFGEPVAIEKLRAGLADRHGVRAAYLAADVARPAEIRELVKETARRFGTVNITLGPTGTVDIPDFTTGMPPLGNNRVHAAGSVRLRLHVSVRTLD